MDETSASAASAPVLARCLELARIFTWLGVTSFGGPAAHVALMERELVERRRWLTHDEFLDLIGLTQLIPGPNSTELAIAIGQRRAGTPGLLVAGLCFTLPAALIVGGLAAFYLRHQGLPALEGPFRLLKPAVVAVVADAMLRLVPSAARERRLALLFGAALAASLLGVFELAIVVVGGLIALVTFRAPPALPPEGAPSAPDGGTTPQSNAPPPDPTDATSRPMLGVAPLLTAAAAAPPSIAGVFLYFLQIGSVLYGSGYVLLAFLRSGLVVERGWITEAQLLDAVAVGQFTPGPVFTTATFVGYLIGGAPAAVAATVGIFLPAFLLIAAIGPLLRRLLLRPWFRPFLDGVNAASLGLLAAVVLRLGAASFVGALPIVVGLVSFAVLLRWRVNSAWVMGAAALLGLVAPR